MTLVTVVGGTTFRSIGRDKKNNVSGYSGFGYVGYKINTKPLEALVNLLITDGYFESSKPKGKYDKISSYNGVMIEAYKEVFIGREF
jgi:hypothetical protein